MVKLRDGSKVRDVRLARIKQFDERSRAFPVRSLVGGKMPRSYTWSCNQWLDQGVEGACVGFAFSHELVARPSVVKGITAKFARERVYWEAQKIDQWSGGAYPGARPFYEGTSVLAGVKVIQKLGFIKEYRWAFGLEDLILAVGYKGPAVIGVNWYDGMYEPNSNGYLEVSGDLVGGHSTLINGVNVREESFNIHNSWGRSWGNGGDAKISFSDMEILLQEQGEAVIPMSRAIAKI